MQKIALLSIKPKFANQILFGVKTYEYRKTPLSPDTTHILIYMTAPVMKIVGIASVKAIQSGAPSTIWEVTKNNAGIVRSFYRAYFKNSKKAYAIELGDITPFNTWVEPKIVDEGFKAPQSFKYVDNDFTAQVIHIGEVKMLKKKNNLIFLAGIHGVGKGYFCNKLREKIDIKVYGASELIKSAKGDVKTNKKVKDIQNNQDLLLAQIKKKAEEGLFILEGHFCLIDEDNSIQDIPLSTFQDMAPQEIFLLEADSEQIQKNLLTRDSIPYEVDFINELLQRERDRAILVATELNIPIKILTYSELLNVSSYLQNKIG